MKRGVFVSAEAPEDSRVAAAVERARTDPTKAYDAETNTLTLDYSLKVKIRPDHLIAGEGLPGTIAHEGSHVVDNNDFNAALVKETRDGVKMDPAVTGNPTIDLTTYETEKRAYRVSAAVAQGQYAAKHARERARVSDSTSIVTGAKKRDDQAVVRGDRSNFVLWDASWGDNEREAKRDQAIDQLLAEPKGVYKGTTPDSPGLLLSGTRPKLKEEEKKP